MKGLISIAVAGLLALPGLVQAQTLAGDDLDDVQCFSLFAMMAGTSGIDVEPSVAGQAEVDAATLLMGLSGGMMYHLGRLEGRAPDVDWLARIADYVRDVEVADLEPSRQRCGKSLSDTGDARVSWGQRLQKE